MTPGIRALSLAFGFVVLSSASWSVGARSLIGNPSMDAAAAVLRPGQFVLNDNQTAPGFESMGFPTAEPITIGISIALQRLYVYRGGVLVAVSTVSTGKPGKRTPLGDFTILQKRRWHRSNIYSNAPMPFMQRLTWDGIAIHAGHNPGFPASHGCIRIPFGFAQTLFAMTSIGEAVIVTDYPVHTPVLLDVVWTDLDGNAGTGFDNRRDGPVRLDYDAGIFAMTLGR